MKILTWQSMMIVALVLIFAPISWGYSQYPNGIDSAAKQLYGPDASYSFSCTGCHSPTSYSLPHAFGQDFKDSALTLFGSKFLSDAGQITDVIADIGDMDSDGDGATNAEELAGGFNPADPNSFPVVLPTCQRGIPAISISPKSQQAAPGSTLLYSVSIQNNDSIECASSTFDLASVLATELSVALDSQAIVLAPGQQGSVQANVSSGTNTLDGIHSFDISASDLQVAQHSVSASAEYIVVTPPPVPVCTVGSPSIAISPKQQVGTKDMTLTYAFIITNNDSAECGASDFSLSLSSDVQLSGTLSASNVNLLAGERHSGSVAILSSIDATAGLHNFSIAVADTSTLGHDVTGSAVFEILKVAAPDTEAPSTPTLTKALSRRTTGVMVWSGSTDNVGVAKYIVWANGVKISETTRNRARVSMDLGSYDLHITAVDAAGNESLPSNTMSIEIAPSTKGRKK